MVDFSFCSRACPVSQLCGDDQRTVDVYPDTTVEQVDRDDKETFVGVAADEDAFDTRQGAARDLDALTFAQVWMREDRQARTQSALDGSDFSVRHHAELIPPVPQNRHQSYRLADHGVARLIDRVPHE